MNGQGQRLPDWPAADGVAGRQNGKKGQTPALDGVPCTPQWIVVVPLIGLVSLHLPPTIELLSHTHSVWHTATERRVQPISEGRQWPSYRRLNHPQIRSFMPRVKWAFRLSLCKWTVRVSKFDGRRWADIGDIWRIELIFECAAIKIHIKSGSGQKWMKFLPEVAERVLIQVKFNSFKYSNKKCLKQPGKLLGQVDPSCHLI